MTAGTVLVKALTCFALRRTASIFGVMGRIEPGANGRRKISIAWTYDERIEDGLYSYHTLEGIRKRIEDPEQLVVTTGEPS